MSASSLIPRRIKPHLRAAISSSRYAGHYLISRAKTALHLPNPKVFCIGRNKTGTTSLEQALRGLGLLVGNQRWGELLLEDWGRRDFRRIIRLAHSADAFQDVPFSKAYTFQAMDAAFLGSKFILTVRDSPDQWYDSVTRYMSRRLGLTRAPTLQDLREAPHIYRGWSARNVELTYGPRAELWPDRQMLIENYLEHNSRVTEYFLNRPNDLLVLNVSDPDSMQRLCAFLRVPYHDQRMPKLNVTAP